MKILPIALRAAALCVLSVSLSGCLAMAVGGAAVGAAGAVVGATAKGVGAVAGAVIPHGKKDKDQD